MSNQDQFIEKLLLSSAISPSVRRDARRILGHEEVSQEQASAVINHLQTIINNAPPRDQRPVEHRIAALEEQVDWYNKQGRKPTIKPLAADLEWLRRSRQQ